MEKWCGRCMERKMISTCTEHCMGAAFTSLCPVLSSRLQFFVYRDDGKPDTSYLNLLRLSPCVSIKSLCTLLIIHSRNLKSEMAISVRLRVFTSCIMKRLFWNLRCCLIYLFINNGGRGRSC